MGGLFLDEKEFTPYGASHIAALVLFAITIALLVPAGRRLRSRPPAARRCRRAFAALLAAVAVSFQTYSMLPPHWDLGRSLPFQLCDLAWMAAVWALWTGNRRAYGLLYYWGLTLTAQAFVTPTLEFDFPHLQFLMFWSLHGLIVLAAVFLTWGLGMRPDWRLYRFAAASTALWALLMLGFNALAGTNYLYVNAKLAEASILDALGPWPLYLAAESALILAVWALITWPWRTPLSGRSRPGSPLPR